MAYRSNDFEDRFYEPRRERAESRVAFNDVDVRDRPREREGDRLRFLRDERPPEAGALVLSRREVESRELSRPRQRSPSPVYRERVIRRARSLTPPPHHHHDQELERSRVRISEREREIRSPSRGPPPEMVRARYVERPRSPSPPPPARERSRVGVRIVEREREKERRPSPSPSPPPQPAPPQVIRGPTIEREVITHYRDIDHGVTRVPSPPPPPRPAPRPITRTEERELDIDITTSRNRTDIDIHRSRSRHRSPSRERRSPAFKDSRELVSSTDRLRIDDRQYQSRRRAHSAAARTPVDEEAEYITSKIDSRGRMGEAWGGATKDWTIVDVPPGTERVKMDGVGGGSAEVTWQRYNGVRRSKFIPEREREDAPISVPAPVPPSPRESRDRLSVQVYDRETEIDIEKTKERRPRPSQKRNDNMWTEITKDLVIRDAIIELGYDFEETEYFFYIMQYLKYDDVLELVQVSDEIRRFRKERVREIEYEKEWRDDWDRRHGHHHHHRLPSKYDDERVYEREVVYDSQRPRRWM
ncbi:conserved glutamic acid rich protein [Colletotrichum truncatum]|uniref:Conserved glutamic acid rich protein n=1 Tax=Colletotrichum truncatum TaxID=5467 RepID=A0ACC3Z0Y2_COLTU